MYQWQQRCQRHAGYDDTMSSASLFRSSKTRSSKTQDQLLSRSLKHKQAYNVDDPDRSVYECSYDIPMPPESVGILRSLISGLTGGTPHVTADMRVTHTVGLWTVGSSAVYRCCFIQPEVSSATSSMPAHRYKSATLATHVVSESICGAVPSAVNLHKVKIQLSGRLAPYVVAHMGTSHEWTFANIAKSKFVFICTDDNGSHMAGLTRRSLEMLRAYSPCNVALIDDIKTKAYKITAMPSGSARADEANKNTCMIVYIDGAFKVTGKPDCMANVGTGFRTALQLVAASPSWPLFVTSLVPL